MDTGYSLTLEDFGSLLREPEGREFLSPLMEEWFGCDVAGFGTDFNLTNGATLEALHAAIQAEPEWQYRVYQVAMRLWR